jgi:perosamine synthetase
VFNKMGLFLNEKYPIAEKLARNGFYVPSGLGLSEEEINVVVQSLLTNNLIINEISEKGN